MQRASVLLIVGALTAPAVQAQEFDFSGAIGAEVVQFSESGLAAQQGEKTQASLSIDAEVRWISADRNTRAQLAGFGRWDGHDGNRTHLDLREAYVAHNAGRFEVLGGVNTLFWGVTESRHLVDVINQRDYLEFSDREARLGQPMVKLSWQFDRSVLSGIVMTGFRPLAFPGPEGRFGFGLPVDEGAATYEASDGKDAIDMALRFAGSFGAADLGLSAFHGTSREPTLSPNTGGTALVPHYARISQVGIDAQLTLDAVLLKFEGLRRSGQGDTFNAAVLGAEYTFYQLFDGASDLGVIGEYLYDGRDSSAPVTPFDDDVFVGVRWAANDTQDTSFLLGATVDVNDQSTYIRAEFDRRLGEKYVLEIAAQTVTNTSSGNPLHALREDGFVSIGVSFNF